MTKGMRKDFRREVKGSFSRFLSILLIVVLGTAFFAGIKASQPAMQFSADKTFDVENLNDIRVVGTLGVTNKDVSEILKVDGVADAEGIYSGDFLCETPNKQMAIKLLSLNDRITTLTVNEGRYPKKYNECVADAKFLEDSGYKIGDKITLSTGTDKEYSETIETNEFTIVGSGTSSYYLNNDRGTTTIGEGVINSFIVVPKEAFSLKVFTEIYVTLKDVKELNCFSNSYNEVVDSVKSRITALADIRCDARYNEFKSESDKLLADARAKFEFEKQKATDGLNEAYLKIADAELNIRLNEDLVAEKKQELIDAKALLETKSEDILTNADAIKRAKSALAKEEEKYNKVISQLEPAKQQRDSVQQYFDANKHLMSPETVKQYKDTLNTLNVMINTSEAAAKAYKKNIDEAKKKIESGEGLLTDGSAAVEAAKETLAKGDTDIIEAEKKLEEGKAELERGKEEYELVKGDVIAETNEAEQKLIKSEEEIKSAEKPSWYVLDRESIPAFTSFKGDADGIGAIGAVFPAIFFLVAALVCLTTMTRMVEEERTQIGTLKALGYSKAAIASKYVLYALIASLIGSIIGVLVGEAFIPALIVQTYTMQYTNLIYNAINLHFGYAALATALAVLCTTGATYAACHHVLRSSPASLMRPEAPKVGKRILLENVDWIWLRLNFAQKAACRNLFRYKKRLFMTILGVGGCMALLLVGFGIKDSVGAMTTNQFNKVWSYQGTAGVDATISRAEKREMFSTLNKTEGVSEYLQSHREMTFAKSPKAEQNAYIMVPQDTAKFMEYVNLKSRVLKKSFTLDSSGVIITEKLSEELKVKVGDKITVRAGETDTESKELTILGVVENYIYHYIYMTPDAYKDVFGKSANLNSILLKTNTTDEEALKDALINIEGINSVTMNSEAQKDVDKTMNNLMVIVFVMIISAGLLAFIVLYNLNNINITERKRELATLKVLGFYNNELSAYVYRENIVLTAIGTVVGIGLGMVLHLFVMRAVETDMIMFGREIHILSYILSILLTIVFTVLVNLVMVIKLKKIDMVESLKSVE